MKRLTEKDIVEINKKVENAWDQGIFKEPNYVPTDIKDTVCFMRWFTEGRGGSCWDDENTVNDTYYGEKPIFEALNLALEKIGANAIETQYIKDHFIESIDNAGSCVGWYGDYDDYAAEWVQLERIYKYLGI